MPLASEYREPREAGAARPTSGSVVVIASSLGGPKALCTVLGALPADFPAAIMIAQHRSAAYSGRLDAVLQRHTALRVIPAEHGVLVQPGTVVVAPVDRHLLVASNGAVALLTAPPLRFARPSADLLFTSAAEVYGPRATGVVLTGRLADGANGAWAIKAMGGQVLAQDPATCEAASMPEAVIAGGCVDFVVPLEQLASVLVALIMVPGTAPLFRVPLATSLARARQSWSA